jgi:hypothetical protein
MEKATINLLELCDSEKLEVLKQARTYLKKQVEEERYCRSVSTTQRTEYLVT